MKTGVQVATAPQLFPTPADLAARMVELADIQPDQKVLEPSAGTGVLCKATTEAEPTASVFAVELNHRLCDVLSSTITPPEDRAEGICRNVLQGEFLECFRAWEVPAHRHKSAVFRTATISSTSPMRSVVSHRAAASSLSAPMLLVVALNRRIPVLVKRVFIESASGFRLVGGG